MALYLLVAFVILGAFAGWFGGMLLKERGVDLVCNMVVGVAGALIGGVLATFGFSAIGEMGSMCAAVIGAAAALAVLSFGRKAGTGCACRARFNTLIRTWIFAPPAASVTAPSWRTS